VLPPDTPAAAEYYKAAETVAQGEPGASRGTAGCELAAEVGVQRSLPMKVTRNLGMLLLAAWLILTGLIPLLNLSFSGLGTVMAILAIAAGVLIVVGR